MPGSLWRDFTLLSVAFVNLAELASDSLTGVDLLIGQVLYVLAEWVLAQWISWAHTL